MGVVVLGAAGGVGSRVVGAAVTAGCDVVAAARSRPSVPREVEAVAVDVLDAAAVRRVLRGADAVLWCVGVTKRSGLSVGRRGIVHVVDGVALVEQAPSLRAKPVTKADAALAMLELAGSQGWMRRSPFLVAR